MNLGWGSDDPNQKSFDAALSNASDVIRGLRAGVDAFNRWRYTNRGNLDGQWQLVKTFDLETGKYVSDIISARVEEIFEKVDEELRKVERSGMLPSGIFLVGNGVKLDGIVEAAFNQIRQYGRSNADVSIRLLEGLAIIAARVSRHDQIQSIIRQIDMIKRASDDSIPEPNDRYDIEERYQLVLRILNNDNPMASK